MSGRSWLWPRRLAKLEGVTRCPGISMPRALVQLAAALALAGLIASPLGCASNPTPHPAADGSGAFGDEASQPTTADSGVSGDVGGVSDLAAPPADGAADDAAPAPLDVSADGDAATGTDADATVGPDAGCGAAVAPCCCDLDVTAEAICDGESWTCPTGYGAFFGDDCHRSCGPCNYAPGCADAFGGSD